MRIEDDLLEEVREMMFNEELRVMIRQNLYALIAVILHRLWKPISEMY